MKVTTEKDQNVELRKSKRDQLFEALSQESDRGLILVSAAFLDDALEQLLKAKFLLGNKKPKSVIEPLFNSIGPLSSFSSKIKLCYALDLISKWEYHDLEIIRKIRNEFAHSIEPASFGSDRVVKLSEKLLAADIAVATIKSNKDIQNKTSKKKSKKIDNQINYKAKMERTRVRVTVSYIGGSLVSKNIILNADAPESMKNKILFTLNS